MMPGDASQTSGSKDGKVIGATPALSISGSSGGNKKRGSNNRGIPRVRSHPDADLRSYYTTHGTVLPPQFR